jgi:hypothetical protein
MDSSARSKRIWFKGAEKFLVAPFDPLVTIAGNFVQPLGVQNGDAAPAHLNKAGMLEGLLDEINGGSLDA